MDVRQMQAVLTPPDPQLADELIVLEPLHATHVPAMRALGDDDDVARFTLLTSPLDHESAREWVERYAAGWGEGTLGGFAVVSADEGAFLGFIGIVRYDAAGKTAELGYIVAPEARGRGVATRALGLLTTWCLDALGLERVELRIDPANLPSLRLAEKLGYVHEGVLRSMPFKDGLRADLAVYSRIPADGRG